MVVLAGHAGGDDVGVVAVRDGDERLGLLDPGLLEHVPVVAHPDHLLRLESGGEPVERLGALVDDRHLVPALRELHGELRADAPATHDHDVHAWLG